MHFLCLLWCGSESSTDSPDGFVCECDILELFGSEVEDRTFELCFDNLVLFACFSFFFYFTDAEYRFELVL